VALFITAPSFCLVFLALALGILSFLCVSLLALPAGAASAGARASPLGGVASAGVAALPAEAATPEGPAPSLPLRMGGGKESGFMRLYEVLGFPEALGLPMNP
jgi:hypothetical protein